VDSNVERRYSLAELIPDWPTLQPFSKDEVVVQRTHSFLKTNKNWCNFHSLCFIRPSIATAFVSTSFKLTSPSLLSFCLLSLFASAWRRRCCKQKGCSPPCHAPFRLTCWWTINSHRLHMRTQNQSHTLLTLSLCSQGDQPHSLPGSGHCWPYESPHAWVWLVVFVVKRKVNFFTLCLSFTKISSSFLCHFPTF